MCVSIDDASLCARARMFVFSPYIRMVPDVGSRPNTFSVSTVRQLVCGSSRNLNPMILGTDPSRVPNLPFRAAVDFEGLDLRRDRQRRKSQ